MARTQTDLRVMVDANILISGSVWPRWPYEVLQHALNGDFHFVLSPYIIAQARKQVNSSFPDHLKRLDNLLDTAKYDLAKDPTENQLAKSSGLVRDPTDIPVALGAINADVDYLVSEDKDLTATDESTKNYADNLTY